MGQAYRRHAGSPASGGPRAGIVTGCVKLNLTQIGRQGRLDDMTTKPNTTRTFTMFGITEPTPGPRWQGLFDATWPAYRAWYLQDGDDARPTREEAEARLEEHLPELVDTYRSLVKLAGDDDDAARMLTMWDMPTFLPGCTQAVATPPDSDERVLVRNYDYSPDLFEWVSYSSEFTGRQVVGTSDCLWGLLDGMNDAGLVVSLTFGGRPGSKPGFGIPIVVRYLLEVAETVEQAVERLETIPVGMAYNLTLTDATGRAATVFVAPGERPEVSPLPAAANHRGTEPEYPEHARRYRSVERQQHALDLVDGRTDGDTLADAFLRQPLHATAYAEGFGTVYTAVYRPADGTLEYRWPDARFTRRFDAPQDSIVVPLHGDWPAAATSEEDHVMSDTALPEGFPSLHELDPASLGRLARAAMSELAERGDQASFAELLTMNGHAGVALGAAARALAANGSWSQVADLTGTTKQAAWSRWRA